jgi:hypothetical protein
MNNTVFAIVLSHERADDKNVYKHKKLIMHIAHIIKYFSC